MSHKGYVKEFHITYTCPKTGKEKEKYVEFSDTETVSAEMWAEDHAYSLADKGPYEIRLSNIKDKK